MKGSAYAGGKERQWPHGKEEIKMLRHNCQKKFGKEHTVRSAAGLPCEDVPAPAATPPTATTLSNPAGAGASACIFLCWRPDFSGSLPSVVAFQRFRGSNGGDTMMRIYAMRYDFLYAALWRARVGMKRLPIAYLIRLHSPVPIVNLNLKAHDHCNGTGL